MSLRRAGSRARNTVAGSPCGAFRCWHPEDSMPRPPATAGRERSDDQTDNSADTELGQGRHGASSVFGKAYDSSSTARCGRLEDRARVARLRTLGSHRPGYEDHWYGLLKGPIGHLHLPDPMNAGPRQIPDQGIHLPRPLLSGTLRLEGARSLRPYGGRSSRRKVRLIRSL